MREQSSLAGTPMYDALTDLARALEEAKAPPIDLNVVGGFALMMRGVRPADGVTDIDFVGAGLPEKATEIIAQVGLAHNMEAGWINNDGMFTGMSMEDFVLSTGELHFSHALTIGPVTINVLEEKDLLRMKVIAVDTAMTELEATGDFARRKDFSDIALLMGQQQMSAADAMREFSPYILCKPGTGHLLSEIWEHGPNAATEWVDKKAQAMRHGAAPSQERSAFVGNLLDGLFKASAPLTEADIRGLSDDKDLLL